jgi:virulence-associated protein VapD
MIKLKSLLSENKILVPRRTPEEREKTLIAEHYRIIQRYIKDGCQGDLILSKSPIKILPDNLTHVGGNLTLTCSKIEDLNKLKIIRGYLDLTYCKNIKSLNNLKHVDGSVYLYQSSIETLNNLERIRGSLYLQYTDNLKSFGNLKYVSGHVYLKESNILNVMSIEDIKKQFEIKGKIRGDIFQDV